MNKEEFVSRYKSVLTTLNLRPRDVIVGAGGVMLMLGIREETADMDLAVTKTIFNEITVGKLTTLPDGTPIKTIDGNIDIHITDKISDGVMVDEVWCDTLRTVYALRKRLNRPKDQIELKALSILFESK